MAQTILQEVQKRMQEMTSRKAADLEAIRQKQVEVKKKEAAAESALKEATTEMNLEAYKAAEKAQKDARTALNMFAARYTQLEQQEYISEEESDRVIDSLLSYEDELEAEFKADIAEPLKKLEEIQKAYFDAVADTEQTIKTWTTSIHANYRRKGTIYRETGTNRSPKPVSVRAMAFVGCNEAMQLRNFLENFIKADKG